MESGSGSGMWIERKVRMKVKDDDGLSICVSSGNSPSSIVYKYMGILRI